MKKHYQIVDENIVFNVVDEEVVLREIEEGLNSAFENPDGEESLNFIVELCEEFADPEDPSNIESYTTLSISAPDSGVIIRYTAKAPILVNVNGKFCHYWDFALCDHTITEMYNEDYEEDVGHLEDLIFKEIVAL